MLNAAAIGTIFAMAQKHQCTLRVALTHRRRLGVDAYTPLDAYWSVLLEDLYGNVIVEGQGQSLSLVLGYAWQEFSAMNHITAEDIKNTIAEINSSTSSDDSNPTPPTENLQ